MGWRLGDDGFPLSSIFPKSHKLFPAGFLHLAGGFVGMVPEDILMWLKAATVEEVVSSAVCAPVNSL
jgi:hypothetical protein